MGATTDQEATDKLINFCRDRSLRFYYLFNTEEHKRVLELCYLKHQPLLYTKYMALLSWEYTNNARVVIVRSENDTQGYFIPLVIQNLFWNINVKGEDSIKRLHLLVDHFYRWKANWSYMPNKYLNNPQNTHRVIPLKLTTAHQWVNADTHDKINDFLGKFEGKNPRLD